MKTTTTPRTPKSEPAKLKTKVVKPTPKLKPLVPPVSDNPDINEIVGRVVWAWFLNLSTDWSRYRVLHCDPGFGFVSLRDREGVTYFVPFGALVVRVKPPVVNPE